MRLWSQESDANLDRGIVLKICNLAKGLDMNKVVLFGSRATKMNGERSDIDLMISEKNASVKAAFINGLEDINTLLIFDVVNEKSYNFSHALEQEIKRDGVILYEK